MIELTQLNDELEMTFPQEIVVVREFYFQKINQQKYGGINMTKNEKNEELATIIADKIIAKINGCNLKNKKVVEEKEE